MFSLKQFSFVGMLLLTLVGIGIFFAADSFTGGEVPVAEAFGDGGGDGCGGCGGGSGGGGGAIDYAPRPSCTLTAQPDTITKGEQAKLVWNTTDATRATVDRGVGAVTTGNGNMQVSPGQTVTYKMTVYNSLFQSSHCTATVTVEKPEPAPTCTLDAQPGTIETGDQATLQWSTNNAETATINHGIGTVSTGDNKTRTVSPGETTTYTMTVENQDGEQANCATKIVVENPAPTPSCTLNAHPSTITKGATAQLKYSTSNATSAYINPDVGQVSVGNYKTKSVTPQQTTTYTLVVKNADGEKENCKTTVQVKDVARTCDLHANVEQVNYGGSVTLTWSTDNFDSVTINGSAVDADGNKTYKDITSDTTYRLEAKTADGSFDCVAVIHVKCVTPPPACTLESDPQVITKGESSTLRWSTEHAVHATINNSVGQVPTGTDKSRSVTPGQTTTYTMVVENEKGDEATCDTKVKVEQPTPTPVCDLFTANPQTITKGESSTLTWKTSNVANVYINQGVGSVSENGTLSVSPLATTLYKLTAVGLQDSVGSDECYVKVKVEDPDPELPTCDFSATPDSLPYGGGTSLLEWDTENADEVTINNGIGSVSRDGDRSVNITDDTQYVLTAKNDDGEKSCKATITVEEPEPELPTCEFSLSPTRLSDEGGNVTLEWDTENADEVTINRGVGEVSNDGSRMVAVTGTTLFTLTATNDYGDDTCTAKVTVDDPEPEPLTCEDNVSFSARPDDIDEGDTAKLRWNTVGVDEVSINRGIGDVSLDGDYLVSPDSDTTYILTASNDDDTVQCPVTIRVDEDNGGGGGGGTVTPRCELEVSDTRIDAGDEIELRWESSNAADIEITDDDGDVIVTTEGRLFNDKKEWLDGEIDLEPDETTTYTMIAVRGSRDDECTVRVRVDESDIVVLEERDQQPLVSSIALTQVPYTGFDAGPALTTLFYALLTVWALFVAYVIVRRRQMAMAEGTPQFTPVSVAEQQSVYNPELFVDYTQSAATTAATATAATATAEPATAPRWASEVASVAPMADATVAELETLAHRHQVLVSHDAITYFLQHMAGARSEEMFGMMLEQARAAYPAEDGWVVLNIARMQQLLA